MEILRGGAEALGLTLGAAQVSVFERYYRELAVWNERFNLTAVTGYEEVQRKHFLDALSCILAFPSAAEDSDSIPDTVPLQRRATIPRCADVGTGAGFPGLPLKIIMPEIRMTLIEATGKKVRFLEHLVGVLGLKQVEILHARAEDVGQMPEHREQYDIVLARAVAHMCVLSEYCLPLARLEGRVIAQKGEAALEEALGAEPAWRALGGMLIHVKPVSLPGLPEERHLVVLSKYHHTPEQYPRRAGIPSKKPLC